MDSCFWRDLQVLPLTSSRVLRDPTHAIQVNWILLIKVHYMVEDGCKDNSIGTSDDQEILLFYKPQTSIHRLHKSYELHFRPNTPHLILLI